MILKLLSFWLKHLGFLYLTSILRENGFEVVLLDALDRRGSELSPLKTDRYGRSDFHAVKVEKPETLNTDARADRKARKNRTENDGRWSLSKNV